MIAFWKYNKIPILFFVLSAVVYFQFAYNLARSETTQLLVLYSILFLFAYKLFKASGFNFRLLVIFSILLRVIFLFATPNLSQDFYRFIWDGRLILEGLNPFLYTPDSFITSGEFPIRQAQELYDGMGPLSASHFSNYPPLNQLCFVLANLVPGKNILSTVIGLRLIIIAADIGILYFGKKLLERLKIPSARIFWYILNPFIIIELTGNLHFEGVMLFFLIWSLYLLHIGKWKWAAVIFACSISVKLIPLMLLPLFLGWFRKSPSLIVTGNTSTALNACCEKSSRRQKTEDILPQISRYDFIKLTTFYTIIGITTLLLFLPFFSIDFLTNYSNTVGLWFGKFEFNASIYYIARAIGYAITGYNEIATIGKILPLILILVILGISLAKRHHSLPHLITSMVLVLSFHFFLSTTVHPWYIASLVLLGLFTNYKFPMVWSMVAVLSYLAYSNTENSENYLIIGLEYGIVYTVFIGEVYIKKDYQFLSSLMIKIKRLL